MVLTSVFLVLCLSLISAADDFFPKDSGVVLLTTENFAKKVSKELWWVLFFSPNNAGSKNLKTEFIGLATELSGMVNVGGVDCKAHPALCEKEANKKYPVIKTYEGGNGTIYDGATTTKMMSERAQKDIPAIAVDQLTAGDHNKWLEQHPIPRAILFHDKKKGEVPVMWRAMSVQFKDRLAFGVAPKSERKLTRRYGVKEFPAVLVVPYVSADDEDSKVDEDEDEDDESNAVGYPGVMTPLAVRDWLSKYALEDQSADDEPLGIEELTDQSCLKAICVDATGLCAVVVVSPNPTNRRKLREEIQVWVQAKDLRSDHYYNFAWIDGVKQSEFISKSFNIQPQEYPQVVVLAGRKNRFASFIGAFEPIAINEFLNGVQRGKIQTEPTTFPPLVGDTTRCKGMKITKGPLPKTSKKIEEEQAEGAEAQQKFTRIPRGHRGGSGHVMLKAENFERHVLASLQPWMIAFVEDKEDEFMEQWSIAAKTFKGMVKFGVLDVSASKDNRQFAEDRFSLSEFPAVRVYKHGKKTQDISPTNYGDTPEDFTSESLISKANDLLQPGDALCALVTLATFDKWVSAAPFVPRLVLFSEKETLPQMMKAIALEFFTEEVLVGAVLNQPDLAQKYGVEQFPRFLFLQGNPNNVETMEMGQSKIAFNMKQLDLPAKLDYHMLQQVGDEMADVWAFQKPRLQEKFDELKVEAEKMAGKASKERSKSQLKSSSRPERKTKTKRDL